jgi:hypothetical protein
MDRKVAALLGAGRKVLRPDQQAALDAAVKQLHRPGARGLYVAATGTGKTLTSIRVAEALQARLVLVVTPTLDLLAQTALAWRAEGHDEAMVIVSSMDAAAHLRIERGNPSLLTSSELKQLFQEVLHESPLARLLTKVQLKDWLQVSDFWVRDRMENDPEFVEHCVVDLAPDGVSRRTVRFHAARTAFYLGIEDDPDKVRGNS